MAQKKTRILAEVVDYLFSLLARPRPVEALQALFEEGEAVFLKEYPEHIQAPAGILRWSQSMQVQF